ncbi:RbsD/FucU domain-containing protein [Urechidicola vernalis]|uniref:D-ribose pyranase n=1 Tax=Urechidicola vernalis TaxID=3075600 RepID=A0ABU2Y464_9FLAO|nr:RbsD/FucU domain-containing protein [Urechidicola sp. P050]MDT0551848.1 RbsD/FucU domain-containing protein [Urechidicola sp. P050]
MNRLATFLIMIFIISCQTTEKESSEVVKEEFNWKTDVENTIKQYGHRNWIVIADSAYPVQSNPAIKTITINESQIETVEFVSKLIDKAPHVHANIFIDKEMGYVQENDAPGIEKYRSNLLDVLKGKHTETMLHEVIIRELDASAKLFDILIIKTDLAIPYTSVFFQLECGYWNAEAENNMRQLLEKASSNEP